MKLRAVLVASIGCLIGIGICLSSLNENLSKVSLLVNQTEEFPEPKGLLIGLGSVAVAQLFLILYQHNRRINESKLRSVSIQLKDYKYLSTFIADVIHHLKRVELFLLVPYLALTWMFNLMPESYYNLNQSFSFIELIFQLLVVDWFTYSFHVILHYFPTIYKSSHKPHHKFTNPQLFDAFDATIIDTIFIILIPLFATANLCHVSCYSYVWFGVTYSTHFMLIHSEAEHSFDKVLKLFGVMTAADHHVHHALFNWNYGHFFTIYDKLGGTYKSPKSIKTFRAYKA